MPEHVYLRGIITIRLLSSLIELSGALLMWRLGRLEAAVRINGLLGLAGPIVLTTTMLIGIAGLAQARVPLSKLVWIAGGVAMILWGTSRG
jgi:hypothetical protein